MIRIVAPTHVLFYPHFSWCKKVVCHDCLDHAKFTLWTMKNLLKIPCCIVFVLYRDKFMFGPWQLYFFMMANFIFGLWQIYIWTMKIIIFCTMENLFVGPWSVVFGTWSNFFGKWQIFRTNHGKFLYTHSLNKPW